MLSICDRSSRFGRREMLRIGTLGLGGLSLVDLLRTQSLAGGSSGGSVVRDKAVVFLFMQGGPSQIETFDPHAFAPPEIRSATGEIDTALPGITFGGTYPKLARMADQFTVVRSYVPGNANHDIKPIVAQETLKASVGALYSRIAGTTHPTRGIPSSVVLYPRALRDDSLPPQVKFGSHYDSGSLGAAYQPFVPGSGPLAQNMRLSMPRERMYERRELLGQLDRVRREIDYAGQIQGLDKFQEQAFTSILGNVADAFDLSKADPREIERYDTAPLVRPEEISRRWNNYNNYVEHGRSLGKLMLLARRLVEAGCGFITVTTDFVWDNHADSNNAGVEEGQRYCGLPFDHAVSTFLTDLEERGLRDKVLLVCCGEIGRTPRINARGGRDHWGNLAPLMLAGAGIPRGKVIGQSTRDGGEALTDPVRISHLLSTIMGTVFDLGQVRLLRNLPTDVIRTLTEHEPIPGLTG